MKYYYAKQRHLVLYTKNNTNWIKSIYWLGKFHISRLNFNTIANKNMLQITKKEFDFIFKNPEIF